MMQEFASRARIAMIGYAINGGILCDWLTSEALS